MELVRAEITAARGELVRRLSAPDLLEDFSVGGRLIGIVKAIS